MPGKTRFHTILIFLFIVIFVNTIPASAQAIWGDVSTRPGVLDSHVMAFDSNRSVLVLFGGTSWWPGFKGTWEWSSASGWIRKNISGPSPKTDSAMVFDSNRNVMVLFGGSPGRNETWEYDGMSWTQKAIGGPSPAARKGHAMAFDSIRSVTVMFGGSVGANQTWEWDGTNWTNVTPASGSPSPIMGDPAMAFMPSLGVTVLFGNLNGLLGPSETWEWDGTSWKQITFTGPVPGDRVDHAMVYDANNEEIMLNGGWYFTGGGAGSRNDTWIYYDDAGTRKWEQKISSGTPAKRTKSAMAYDSVNKQVLLYAGTSRYPDMPPFSFMGFSDDFWSWKAHTWSRIPILEGPSMLSGTAMVYDTYRHRIVLFGGKGGGSDTWEWDGNTWTKMQVTGPRPSSRSFHAMAYDSKRRRTVLFGGTIGGDQTWEWDGIVWQNINVTGPSARAYHAMAFDSFRNRIVLVGGNVSNGNTWEYDGGTWEMVSSSGPNNRWRHAIAFDKKRRRLVLFGGVNYPSKTDPENDTWEWDGTNWLKIGPATSIPSARDGHCMAWDNTRKKVVMFGGRLRGRNPGGMPPFDWIIPNYDTWDWDGHSWRKIGSDSSLKRFFSAMAHFEAGNQMIFVGGSFKSWSEWAVTEFDSNSTFAYSSTAINTPPQPQSVTPDGNTGQTQTFRFTFYDDDGAFDINQCFFKFMGGHSQINIANFRYIASVNKLYLRKDGDNGWIHSVVGSGGKTLSNGQVSVDASNVLVTKFGNLLTIEVPMEFSFGFNGTKWIYMRALDRFGAYSDWDSMGNYTVNAAPLIISVLPDNQSGISERFEINYCDFNGANDLKYLYFKVNSNNRVSCCAYIRYRITTNKLDLRSDPGGTWTGGYVVGSAQKLENGQVTIDVSKVLVSSSGTDVELSVPMEFKKSFAGTKSLYVNALDSCYASSGWQNSGIYNVTAAGSAPFNHEVSPSNGTGAWKTFNAVYGDSNGADDLGYLYFKIADSPPAVSNSVYVRYRCATNKIDLRTNAGGGWIFGSTLGSESEIQNSRVSINLKYAKALPSGKYITLTLPMIFRAGFAGDHNIYMYCIDKSNLNSGWQQMGTFSVTASAAPAKGEIQIMPWSNEIDRGSQLQFNDYLIGAADAAWFVGNDRIRGNDPGYRFDHTGMFQINFTGRNFDNGMVISADQLFVGEMLVRASDLLSWDGDPLTLRLKGKRATGVILTSTAGDTATIVRLNGVLTLGTRLVFNFSNGSNYSFIELNEGMTPEKWQLVYGRTENGKDRIIASQAVKSSDAEHLLALRLPERNGSAKLYLDKKRLFADADILFLGGKVALLSNAGNDLDIIITHLEK